MNIETLIDSMPGMIDKDGLFYILSMSKTPDDEYVIVYKGTGGYNRNPILCEVRSTSFRGAVMEMVKQIRKNVIINDW